MMSDVLTFLGVALLAAFFGFWGLAGMAADMAKIFSLIFVVLMIVAMFKKRAPRV